VCAATFSVSEGPAVWLFKDCAWYGGVFGWVALCLSPSWSPSWLLASATSWRTQQHCRWGDELYLTSAWLGSVLGQGGVITAQRRLLPPAAHVNAQTELRPNCSAIYPLQAAMEAEIRSTLTEKGRSSSYAAYQHITGERASDNQGNMGWRRSVAG